MNEDVRKHLEFIQNTINRISTNSFQLKGLTITITSALLALYASKPNLLFIVICIPQTLFFWLLDSYYLQQERKFRGIYKDAAGLTNNVITIYEMPLANYKGGKYGFWSSFFSFSKRLFFGSITLTIIALLIIIELELISKIAHYIKNILG